ncbi:hypothetical protein KY361_02000 [Candidatus Woesearchaeota archaeon]|nr:hypothetical protein [Candidatus Woesearchaeota archaeon]
MVERWDYYHLGNSLALCDRLLGRIRVFFASTEKEFVQFEDNLMRLKDVLAPAYEIRNPRIFKKLVISYAKACTRALKAIKTLSKDIIEVSEADENALKLQEGILNEQMGEIKRLEEAGLHKERESVLKEIHPWMTTDMLVRNAFAELRKLINIAKVEIHEVIDPELAELQGIISQAVVLTAQQAVKSLKKKGVNEAALERIIVRFRYVLGNVEKLSQEEVAESREIAKISAINEDLHAAKAVLVSKLRAIQEELERESRARKGAA